MFIGDDYIPDQNYESEDEEEYYYYQDVIEAEKNRDLSWLYEDDDDPYVNEEWRPVPGYEGLYEVSNMGRIKSLEREVNNNGGKRIIKEKILTQYVNKRFNYATVILTKMHKSIARKGCIGYSHPQTEEAKEKIRQYHIGLKQSEETKRKLSEYHKGKSIPKEVKEKELLVKHQKGIIHLQEDKNGNLIYKNGLIDPRKYQD